MTYWHDSALKFPLQEVASRYPKTYQRVGDELRKKGLTSEGKHDWSESRKIAFEQWIAILAAMPPHVVPYESYGDSRTWAQHDWTSVTTAIAMGSALILSHADARALL
jgi:hypothetical protein